MRVWRYYNGGSFYRHGKYVYDFSPDDPASERLAYVSCLHGTPPLDEMFVAEIDQGLLYVRGGSGRFLMLDATGRLWLKSREEAVTQETAFLIQQHQAKRKPQNHKTSQPITAKAEKINQQAGTEG